jgi:hypothetical protein
MDDSWHYIDLVCPVCGGKVRHYFDFNVCEDCHYTLPDSNATQELLYYVKDCGSGIAHGRINPEDLIANTLTITNCELIKLHHKELDIEFEFDVEKIENINTIEINGHRFVREKNTND